jgi:hypothetical protein
MLCSAHELSDLVGSIYEATLAVAQPESGTSVSSLWAEALGRLSGLIGSDATFGLFDNSPDGIRTVVERHAR